MNGGAGGFSGSVGLVGLAGGVALVFVALPYSFDLTWPWLSQHVLPRYSLEVWDWAPTFWKCVLGLSIFALFRLGLHFTVALFGFLLALILMLFRRKG